MDPERASLTPLRMAEDLDSMERDVSSWEAGFLDSILTRLRHGIPLSPTYKAKLEELYEHYLEDGSDDPEDEVDL